jgi:membrane protein required for colicin V production
MSSVDIILLVFIGLLAIFGFIRGVVSQAMSVAGLIAAYFFSAQLSEHIVARIAQAMGSSESYARPFAVLWAAVMIYIACRLIGFGIEKIFINQSDSLKSLNRIGGGFLGAIKGCLILFIAFYILRLVPQETLEAHAPKISESKMYQFFAHNQLFDPKYIETLAEPVTKSAQDLMKKTPLGSLTETPPISVTEPKNKKSLEKTEAKMNDEELVNAMMKRSVKNPKPTNTSKKKQP